MRRIPVAGLGLALLATTPALAHHSGAMFDRSQQKVISGTVKEFNWENPHASFKVDVADPGGQAVVWAVEMNSPNNLLHDGWKRSTLKPGDKVAVSVYPLRDGRPGGSYAGITLADGRRLGAEPQAAR